MASIGVGAGAGAVVGTAIESPAVNVRQRHSARRLTAGQLGDLRRAIAAAQALPDPDERGYQHFAGIHGLPLPAYCTHDSPLFLPWHRAYLYFFERALQDLVPGVMVPWWDWTANVAAAEAIPAAYGDERDPDGQPNPLAASPIQPGGQRPGGPAETARAPRLADAPPLPSSEWIDEILDLGDFLDFSEQLEQVHGGVHVWTGGTMRDIANAAYDPIFWAHHAMVDRVWRLWQLGHPQASPPATLLARPLAPFPMTVADTLDVSLLGYDYAGSTAGAPMRPA